MSFQVVSRPENAEQERLLDYSAAVIPVHEQLRLALIQFSGFALLSLTRRKGAFMEFELIEKAKDHLAHAQDEIENICMTVTAAHAHSHFRSTIQFLSRCRDAALSDPRELSANFFSSLDEAQRHFKAASKATPGVAPVDFSQACCSFHTPASPASGFQFHIAN